MFRLWLISCRRHLKTSSLHCINYIKCRDDARRRKPKTATADFCPTRMTFKTFRDRSIIFLLCLACSTLNQVWLFLNKRKNHCTWDKNLHKFAELSCGPFVFWPHGWIILFASFLLKRQSIFARRTFSIAYHMCSLYEILFKSTDSLWKNHDRGALLPAMIQKARLDLKRCDFYGKQWSPGTKTCLKDR